MPSAIHCSRQVICSRTQRTSGVSLMCCCSSVCLGLVLPGGIGTLLARRPGFTCLDQRTKVHGIADVRRHQTRVAHEGIGGPVPVLDGELVDELALETCHERAMGAHGSWCGQHDATIFALAGIV